jgi:xylono-1,5-lactonase
MGGVRVIDRDRRDALGEGLLWSPASGALFWVDILGQRLWSMSLADESISGWDLPERVGWVIERQGRPGFLAGFKSGIVELTLDPLTIAPLVAPEPDRPSNRLNDAKADAFGRLWFGSMDDRGAEASGALYVLEPDARPIRQDDGYTVTNGPAFSPDGRMLYHTDSGRGSVYRFTVNDDRSLGPLQDFIQFDASWGSPDGMTVDREGCLWIAHWGGARVSRFDPAGRHIRSIALPTSNITNCTFAGERLDRMFVTSAALDAENEELAGALFEIDPGVEGLPPCCFAG